MNHLDLILNMSADVFLYVGILAAAVFTLHYALAEPHLAFRSIIGRMFLGLGAAFVLFGMVVASSLIFGLEYPFRGLVRFVGYAAITSAMITLLVTYLSERRAHALDRPKREVNPLTTNSPPEHAAVSPSASFAATARKAFAGGAAGAFTAIGTSVPLVFADGQFTTADAFIVLGAVVGAFAIGFAAVYQVPNAAS